jgi:hypothetical protein
MRVRVELLNKEPHAARLSIGKRQIASAKVSGDAFVSDPAALAPSLNSIQLHATTS